MVKREINDDQIKIYSDQGKKIKQVQTGRVYSVAYESLNGFHYDYVEMD